MATKNIKYQFCFAINQCFKEGQDKYSLKQEGLLGKETIFSYSSRKDLIDLSASFSNWLKKEHSEIKQVKDISSSVISEFLNHKSEVCSQKSLETYTALFKKICYSPIYSNWYARSRIVFFEME